MSYVAYINKQEAALSQGRPRHRAVSLPQHGFPV